MPTWNRVTWTEAGQIAEQLSWPADLDGYAAAAPEVYFAWLKQNGRTSDAAYFLGQALSRFDTVAWAARVLVALGAPPQDPAMAATVAWLRDPSEPNRRAAWSAALQVPDKSPTRMAAMAAALSGGSMSPEGQHPVPAPHHAAGRFAAGAVLAAAIQSNDQPGVLAKALEEGERIAVEGPPPI